MHKVISVQVKQEVIYFIYSYDIIRSKALQYNLFMHLWSIEVNTRFLTSLNIP